MRAADVPADESHPYGHEKIEHLAAAVEGVLILVVSGVIVFEAIRHLIEGTGVAAPRRGHRGAGRRRSS